MIAGHENSRTTLTELHGCAVHEVVALMEGLYSNVDDGLFEMADRDCEGDRRERCFNLMRELRLRRSCLILGFTGTLQRLAQFWFVDDTWGSAHPGQTAELSRRLSEMTTKSDAHFTGLLRLIAERACHATSVDSKMAQDLPISPSAISLAFVESCQAEHMDEESIELVLNLFSRFVLDRLGQVYANCNSRLREAGYRTLSELELAANASSA